MEALHLFISSYIVIIITWLVGSLFSIPFPVNKSLPDVVRFFIKLAIGYLIIPLCYSLFYTKGYTIFTGVLFLYVIVLLLKKKELGKINIAALFGEWKYILWASIPLLLYLILQFIRSDFFDSHLTGISTIDNGVYTTVAEYIKITGIEVSSPWYQLFGVSNDGIAKVYHYEDFWYMAFISDIYNITPLHGYTYVFSSSASLINFLGFISIAFAFRGNIKIISWVVLLAFSCVLFNMVIPEVRWTNFFGSNTFNYPKIAAFPIIISLGVISRRFNITYLDVFAFGYIILVDALFMPTVFSASVLLFGYDAFIKKNNQAFKQLALIGFSIGFFLLFYSVFGSFSNSSTSNVPPGDKSYIFYLVKITTAVFVYQVTYFFPIYLTIGFLFYKKQLNGFHKEVILFFIALLFCSSLSLGLLNSNMEAFQFPALTHGVISAMMILVCFTLLVPHSYSSRIDQYIRKFLISLLIIPIIYGIISMMFLFHEWQNRGVEKSFLRSVKTNIEASNKIGVSISNPDTVTSFTIDPRICNYCTFLKQVGNGYWVNRINIPETLDENPFPERSEAIKISPFYSYLQKLKAENRFTNFENAQIKFIENYEVDYVVVEEGAIVPAKINQCVEKVIKDSYSGTSVLFLKRPCINEK